MIIKNYEITLREVSPNDIHVGVLLNGKIRKSINVNGTIEEIEQALQTNSELRKKIEEKIGEI